MKNWRTTVAGLLAGGLSLIANGTDIKHALFAVGIGALGWLAGDKPPTVQ